MRLSRFERGMDGTRMRYAAAVTRLERALAEWRAARVPLDVVDGEVPPWTARQLDATERVVLAWANLLECRHRWEALLKELGSAR